jgi:hypothetical protein
MRSEPPKDRDDDVGVVHYAEEFGPTPWGGE